MTVDTITQLISNIGFPIAISIILIWILCKQNEEAKKSDDRWKDLLGKLNSEWQTVINNNTTAINEMLKQLESFSKSNQELRAVVEKTTQTK